MAQKIVSLLLIILVGLVAFVVGQLTADSPLGFRRESELASIDNPLVTRFNPTTEKRTTEQGPIKLSSDSAAFPVISATGKEVVYYLPENGEIRSLAISGISVSSLIGHIRPGAVGISWGPNRKELIASYTSGSVYYNLESGLSKKLDFRIRKPVFSPTGDKIAYLYFDSSVDEGALSVADPQVIAFKQILPTRYGDWLITWIDSKTLALLTTATPTDSLVSLLSLDTETGQTNNILTPVAGLETNWSPNGKKLAYSTNSEKANLNIRDLSQGQDLSFNLAARASRCVWSSNSKTIYCAGASTFVALDTAEPVAQPRVLLTSDDARYAENLLLSGAEDYLLLRNNQNDKLYKLRLNQ